MITHSSHENKMAGKAKMKLGFVEELCHEKVYERFLLKN